MTQCPDRDLLLQLLSGTLPLDDDGCRAHLAGCSSCQAALDELSDDPEVRGWAAAPSHWRNEPPLDRLIDELCATSALGHVPDRRPGLLPALGPPRRHGDLGSLGPYRVLAEVGRGGMGIVFRGHDDALDRPVAVKLLRPEQAGDGLSARMLNEAQAAARFRHDHAVNVHAVASTADGLPYIVMEYLVGQTLAERLRTGPPLSVRSSVELIVQVADALGAAHAAGLIHRDVKPGNIFLEDRPGEPGALATDVRAKLLDFGRRELLRHCCMELGWVHYERNQASQAEAVFLRCRSLAEEMVRDRPVDGEQAAALADVIFSLARLRYEHQLRPDEALRDFEQARTILDRLIAEYPDVRSFQFIAWSENRYHAAALRETGRLKEALRLSSDAVIRAQKLQAPMPSDPYFQEQLATAYQDRAEALIRLERFDEARADCDRAAACAVDKPIRQVAPQLRMLAEGYRLLERGQPARAAAAAQALAREPAGDGKMRYLAATLLARCAAAEPGCAEQALALLRQAQKAGFFRLPSRRTVLENDPDLAGLRQRDDYKDFVRQVAVSH